MLKQVRQRDEHGHFVKGHTTGRGNNKANTTGKQLKQLCMDVLNSETGFAGQTLIEDVIRKVARDKPEALLPFTSKVFPQEIEAVVTKASPIVFTAELPAMARAVEQPAIEAKPAVEPVIKKVEAVEQRFVIDIDEPM